MKLSLVIPTYKKEDVVAKQITRLYNYLRDRNITFEILIVIDGIADRSKEVVESLIKDKKLRNVKVIGYKKNRGKGYAVRYGMKRAKGDIVGFTDADTDILVKTLDKALNRILKGDVDIVIPSKLDPKSNFKMSLKRKIFSVGLRAYNKLLLRQPKGIRDISTGLKLFTKESAKLIFPNMTVDRFALDSEIMDIAARNDMKVASVPAYLNGRSKSTSTNISAITGMMLDIYRISLTNQIKNVVTLRNIVLSSLNIRIDN